MTVRDLLQKAAALDVDPDDVIRRGGLFVEAPVAPSVAGALVREPVSVIDAQHMAAEVIAGWSAACREELSRFDGTMRHLYRRYGVVDDGNRHRRGSLLRAVCAGSPGDFAALLDTPLSEALVYLEVHSSSSKWK